MSAGEIMGGKSTNDAHNVVYITSDILQSHYNALHHVPETISKSDWSKFRRRVKAARESLTKIWADIIPMIPGGEDSNTTFNSQFAKDMGLLKEHIEKFSRKTLTTAL